MQKSYAYIHRKKHNQDHVISLVYTYTQIHAAYEMLSP